MDKCTVVAKKELFYAWPFGLAAWLCGLIFIDRLNSDKARATINKATTLIKEKKVHGLSSCSYINLLIFLPCL
jgi:lysophosphatidate acyltransferase